MTTFSRYLQEQMDKKQLSKAALARLIHVDRSSVTTYLNNGVIPKRDTRERLAQALAVPAADVHAAADDAPSHGVFHLPADREADAQTLDRSQSELIYEMIRHLAEGNRRQGEKVGTDEQRSAPISSAGTKPAQEDYNLAADDSQHEGDYGMIGPDEIGHDT